MEDCNPAGRWLLVGGWWSVVVGGWWWSVVGSSWLWLVVVRCLQQQAYELAINNHRPPTTDHQPPTTNQTATTNHQPPTTN
jgi:hypothetical protein